MSEGGGKQPITVKYTRMSVHAKSGLIAKKTLEKEFCLGQNASKEI
jgi:hypothetical protein